MVFFANIFRLKFWSLFQLSVALHKQNKEKKIVDKKKCKMETVAETIVKKVTKTFDALENVAIYKIYEKQNTDYSKACNKD